MHRVSRCVVFNHEKLTARIHGYNSLNTIDISASLFNTTGDKGNAIFDSLYNFRIFEPVSCF